MFLQKRIIFDVFYLYVFKGLNPKKASDNELIGIFNNIFNTGCARFFHSISTGA